ncbi:MAG: FKBP-type peptidyl-prolyl cis-trans isomerase [Actinomycetota bacterium]|nr:FKBP-type peptidyl-prolyl cis-trans isomerase [Actinomycetota bacterium]
MKRIAIAAASATLLIGLTACGSQTDERVEPDAISAEETAPAEELQSSIAAGAPYVTVDCVSTQAMPTDSLPTGSVTVGSASAAIQPNGAPTVTIATDATPATELGIAEVVEGSGAEAVAGDTLTVNYCGVGLGTQSLFDSSYANGTPATFPLDGVIAGWQEGVPGMKVGGTRLLVIPGELAYGDAPPPGIDVNETLVFTVELISIG